MSTAQQVLAEIRAEREAEARWARYRREASPPTWIVIPLFLAILGGVFWFAAFLLKHPEAFRINSLWLIWPFCVVLWLASLIERRREKTLLRIVREEAPALYEKLKEEGLVR